MSFILDALKKLEQKQQQGSIPDLMTVHDPESNKPKKRLMLPYLVLAALLLNAALFTIWLSPWESENSEITIQSALEGQDEPAKTGLVMENSITQVPVSGGLSERDITSNLETEVTEKLFLADPHTIIKEEPVVEQEEIMPLKQQAQAEADEQERIIEKQEPEDENIASLEIPPAIKEMEPVTDLAPAEKEQSVNYTRDSENKVLEIDDLPQSVRRDLPKITVSGHIYSDDPESRVVNINSRILREGEFAAENLKVTEITESGIIFSYGELRFHVRAF
jgi:general secretion pathway protein B